MRNRVFHSLLRKFRSYGIDPECALGLNCEHELECLIKALQVCKGLKVVQLAIDPGETVGLALLVDTVPVWSWEGSPSEAYYALEGLLEAAEPDRIVTSKGGLSLLPPKALGYEIVIVDEFGTSKRKIRGLRKHASSAFIMATRNSISRRITVKMGGTHVAGTRSRTKGNIGRTFSNDC